MNRVTELVFQAKAKNNPLKGILRMEVTDEIVKNIQEAKFAWRQLIPHAQATVIVAEANAGKTTLMTHISADMAKEGYQVIYINADASATQIKEYFEHAKEHNYHLINPDLTNGTPEEVVTLLQELAKSEDDLSMIVIVLDTLKKYTDLMSKAKAKQFYALIRSLTAKAVTVICLAHANKYKTEDGMPIYEGTGDTRNDCDNLIYLIPTRDPDGTMTVSTLMDKQRAKIKDITFTISEYREVQVLEKHINTLAINKFKKSEEADSKVIEFILKVISQASKSPTELYEIAKEREIGIGKARLFGVLKKYASSNEDCLEPKWLAVKALTHGFRYGLISHRGNEIKEQYE